MRKTLVLAGTAAVGSSALAHGFEWDSGPGLGWAIPDLGSITRNFTPSGLGPQILQFDVFMNPQHTWINDLRIDVTAPGGQVVQLLARNAGSEDMISMFFIDGGVAVNGGAQGGVYDSATSGVLYAPGGTGALSSWTNPNAQWTLFAADDVGADIGTIDRIRIHSVPEPGTMLAIGAGLAALAARRRRK